MGLFQPLCTSLNQLMSLLLNEHAFAVLIVESLRTIIYFHPDLYGVTIYHFEYPLF